MASQLAIQELTIADLWLHEDDEIFADAVACVQAYWSQASQLDAKSQRVMRQLVIDREFAHTKSSRECAGHHRLHRRDGFSWPEFLILNALYKRLPMSYLAAIRERNLPTVLEDHTDDYLKVFPNTVLPIRYNTDTPEGEAYRKAWPKLKNTPTIYRKKEQDTVASTEPTTASALPVITPAAVTADTQIHPETQQVPGQMTLDKPELRHAQSFQTSKLIFSTPVTRAPIATVTAAPYASVQTLSEPQSIRLSVPNVINDADAEEDASVSSALSGGRKRGPSWPPPTMSTKRQDTKQDTFESMIQSLQSPATTSAKPKTSANAIHRLEQRFDVLETQMMAVLVAMTNEIKVLKEKVAMLENV